MGVYLGLSQDMDGSEWINSEEVKLVQVKIIFANSDNASTKDGDIMVGIMKDEVSISIYFNVVFRHSTIHSISKGEIIYTW